MLTVHWRLEGWVHEHIFDSLSSVAEAANTVGFVAVRGAKMPTSG